MARYRQCCLGFGMLCVASLLAATSATANTRGRDTQAPSATPNPTAWAWIQSQPELTTAAQVLTVLGAEQQLMAPFTGTLLLPTNEAFQAYLNMTQAPLDLTGTTSSFWMDFLGKLIKYHLVLRSVSASQFTPEAIYTTNYTSINGGTHKVKYVAASGCVPRPPTTTKYGHQHGGTPCPTQFIVDEQQNEVTFAAAKTAVLGGGQISTINAVLQPSDIFPSLVAAVAGPDFSVLRNAIDLINAGLNISLLADLEKIPGTLAAPTNQAFEGVDVASLPPNSLLRVVTYHFCGPVQVSYRLLYTPFAYPTRRNPCTTLLARTIQDRRLQLSYRFTGNGFIQPPTMWINFPTGNANATGKGTAPIIMADITSPLHVSHVISKLLLPPQ